MIIYRCDNYHFQCLIFFYCKMFIHIKAIANQDPMDGRDHFVKEACNDFDKYLVFPIMQL